MLKDTIGRDSKKDNLEESYFARECIDRIDRKVFTMKIEFATKYAQARQKRIKQVGGGKVYQDMMKADKTRSEKMKK